MPVKKVRETRSTAPTPSPAPGARASTRSRSRSHKTAELDEAGSSAAAAAVPAIEDVAEVTEEEEQEAGEEPVAPEDQAASSQGGDTAAEGATAITTSLSETDGQAADGADGGAEGADVTDGPQEAVAEDKEKGKATMEERMAKLKDLRIRMNQSSAANRKDLVSDHQKQKVTAKEVQRLEKQKKLAQTLRLKAEAEASGEDMERRKAWEWSIEQNERWEAKMEEQRGKLDNSFHNAEDDAWKKYNRNVKSTKADLVAYERQKEAALGLAPGTLVPIGATSQSLQASGSRSSALTLSEDLYRGADTLSYGDNKPSEDAVDRVIGKINKDMDKGKRKKKEEDEGEINYINDKNKVFNKKVARYFDKYTKEIRANFERGTAL